MPLARQPPSVSYPSIAELKMSKTESVIFPVLRVADIELVFMMCLLKVPSRLS